jgi:hypothetical protein
MVLLSILTLSLVGVKRKEEGAKQKVKFYASMQKKAIDNSCPKSEIAQTMEGVCSDTYYYIYLSYLIFIIFYIYI